MTKIENLQDLREWVQEEGFRRSADINIGTKLYSGYEEQIWVYDYELQQGQYIDIPGEVTFYEEAKESMEKEIESIQKRMERVVNND